MGSVHQLRTDDKLEEFFEYMFGESEGYTYSPTLHPITKDWEQYFFKWPEQKQELVEHVRRFASTHEIYYAPALYSRPSATKDDFLGTWFVWAEFDGTVPNSLVDVPEPCIKIQSSDESHQHWYWKLDTFISDIQAAEQISGRLTYHLKADLSAWNANRVLRPPDTVHHESSRQTQVLRWDAKTYGVQDFAQLPDVQSKLLGEDDVIGEVPEALDVIFKYPFSEEDARFFKLKEIKPGHETGSGKGRSAALARLGHICAEMGMSTAESLALLLHADNRWGKYSKRRDQRHRLLGIINYARAKHPIDPVEESVKSPLRVYTLRDFMSQPKEVDWLIEGFVHRKGFLVTFGQAGVGKSQLLLRACEAFATGSAWLKWQVTRPIRMMYISLEMPDEELYDFVNTMKIRDNPDPLAQDNFLVMPVGTSIKMGLGIAKEHLNRKVEEWQPDGIVIDSYMKAVGDNVSEHKVVEGVVDYIDTYLRLKYGCFVWFIHHPRKEQPNNRKPNKLSDMYGGVYLENSVTTATTLWKAPGGLLKFDCVKMRLAKAFDPILLRRTPNLNFEIVDAIKRNTGPDDPIFNGGLEV